MHYVQSHLNVGMILCYKCTQYTHGEWNDLSNNLYLYLNTPPFQDRAELQDNTQDHMSPSTASDREVRDDVSSRSSSAPMAFGYCL